MSETPELSPEAKRERWRSFAVLSAAASVSLLDISKINVALPSLSVALSASSTILQLLVAGYTLVMGLLLIPSGRLGDLWSRRNMFLLGLVAFVVTSIFSAMASDANVLLIARLLQGVAAGIMMPQVMGIIQQMFQGTERGMALGIFGAIMGISTAFGPALGGILVGVGDIHDGWRLIFWMNVPIGIVVILFALKYLPKYQAESEMKAQMDLVGVLLLGIAILVLMIPFAFTTGKPTDNPNRWFCLVAFVVFAFVFIWWEKSYQRRGKTPVINFSLFQLASFRNGSIVATLYFTVVPPLFLLSTLYLQQGLGIAAAIAGLVGAPFAIASAVTSWLGGSFVFKYGRKLVIAGIIIFGIGTVLALVAAIYSPPELVVWLMMPALALAGAGSGVIISPNQVLMLEQIPIAEGGVAGAISQVGQRVGTSVGVAITSSIFYATIYAAGGSAAKLPVYHSALFNSVIILFVVLALALLFAVLDLFSGRRNQA